jgi:hypothetical protein
MALFEFSPAFVRSPWPFFIKLPLKNIKAQYALND